uniref:basic salivary proline-rich protein 3-like n=1 Tax=Podarcis muralis TaxID=64176 RepID=UPI00109EFC31|nr:basic salivary proline-rich protein 3-like [Podarcis muralis]
MIKKQEEEEEREAGRRRGRKRAPPFQAQDPQGSLGSTAKAVPGRPERCNHEAGAGEGEAPRRRLQVPQAAKASRTSEAPPCRSCPPERPAGGKATYVRSNFARGQNGRLNGPARKEPRGDPSRGASSSRPTDRPAGARPPHPPTPREGLRDQAPGREACAAMGSLPRPLLAAAAPPTQSPLTCSGPSCRVASRFALCTPRSNSDRTAQYRKHLRFLLAAAAERGPASIRNRRKEASTRLRARQSNDVGAAPLAGLRPGD